MISIRRPFYVQAHFFLDEICKTRVLSQAATNATISKIYILSYIWIPRHYASVDSVLFYTVFVITKHWVPQNVGFLGAMYSVRGVGGSL